MFSIFTFSLVGGVGTAAHFTVLILLVSGLHLHQDLESSVGFLVGMVISYALNKTSTFSSTRAHGESFWRFFTAAVMGIRINTSAMALLTISLNFHYLLAQALAIAQALSLNFLSDRLDM